MLEQYVQALPGMLAPVLLTMTMSVLLGVGEGSDMLLELDHISKIYGDLHAVDDLSLTVPEGEWLAIVGSSGSGKTTLMNIIGCMDAPSHGSVALEGRRLEDLNATQLADVRKNVIGLVFQKFYLVPYLTAVENVMMAQYYHSVVDEQQALEALDHVGLKDRAHHLPGELSGGEQQRVCIARAHQSSQADSGRRADRQP